MHGMSYAFVHFVYVPLTDGGYDRQRACTCHFFTVSGSLIPHFSENNIQTKEEKSNKRKINTLIISLLMKYSYFVKIS
jgi:hypothetical protein